MWAFGIDIGGTGIKFAEINLANLLYRDGRRATVMKTPASRSVDEVCHALSGISADIPCGIPCGVAFPGLIEDDVITKNLTLHNEWVGKRPVDLLGEALGRPVAVINDAAAAGCAEMIYGAGARKGIELMITVGTGVSTALFRDGRLDANQYFGEVFVDGVRAYDYVSRSARDAEGLSNHDWSLRFMRYLDVLRNLTGFDRVILGGGISWAFAEYADTLNSGHIVAQASLKNRSGLIGGAWFAAKTLAPR